LLLRDDGLPRHRDRQASAPIWDEHGHRIARADGIRIVPTAGHVVSTPGGRIFRKLGG